MNSFNHYAFGSVVAWVYRSVAAIDAGAPGFKKIVIRPRQDPSMKSVRGEYDSVYGKIISAWHAGPDGFALQAVIPPNTTAEIYLPLKTGARISEGGRAVESRPGPEGTAIVAVGSGSYEFKVQ
jgi:alpha-L-rhamnosidase